MTDIEIMNVMLGNFPGNSFERQEADCGYNVDLGSRRLHIISIQIGEHFRYLLNTNGSENSEITAEIRRAINSETSSQIS